MSNVISIESIKRKMLKTEKYGPGCPEFDITYKAYGHILTVDARIIDQYENMEYTVPGHGTFTDHDKMFNKVAEIFLSILLD